MQRNDVFEHKSWEIKKYDSSAREAMFQKVGEH